MQIGMIGLGRMGANMARRLLKAGHQCVVFDMSPQAVAELVKKQPTGSSSVLERKLMPSYEVAMRVSNPDRSLAKIDSF